MKMSLNSKRSKSWRKRYSMCSNSLIRLSIKKRKRKRKKSKYKSDYPYPNLHSPWSVGQNPAIRLGPNLPLSQCPKQCQILRRN
jgi:hypothetical protein